MATLPLVFHKRIELDTFILERILDRWIGHALTWADIAPEMMHLLKGEAHTTLQRRLRARISTYWSRPDASAKGLDVLRTLDADVVSKERDLRERSALVLREFGYQPVAEVAVADEWTPNVVVRVCGSRVAAKSRDDLAIATNQCWTT